MIFLREYQSESVDALYKWFQNNEGNPLIVLPTGAGKSLVSAKIDEDALRWPNQRVLNLTHSQELIAQNYDALLKLWPEAPAGIYCAGLGKKQHHHRITFGSIASVYRKPDLIGWRDIIKVDEAHLIGEEDDGMYRKFLAHMAGINPDVRVIGLSATPWRLKSGMLHKGPKALFSDIAYDLPVTRLVKEGYLTALVNKAAVAQGNTKKLSLQGGEFALREANTEFDRQEMTKAAVDEMLVQGEARRSWLVFCILKEHAQHVCEALQERGISAAYVTDDTPNGERAKILNDFKAGHIRAVTNVGVLTTGFDARGIDLIAMLRPTMSPGLLVQMLGRGMRPVYAPGADLTTVEGRLAGIASGPKPNCLVMDFAGNLERHGPITHIRPPDGVRRKADRDGKMCLSCRSINAFDATECCDCGAPFSREGGERKIKHATRASGAEVMSDAPVLGDVPVWLDVKRVHYQIHNKPGAPESLRVDYNCSPHHINEWICPGHSGYAREKFLQWWRARAGKAPEPVTAREALARIEEVKDFFPQSIRVKKEGKYHRVLSYNIAKQDTFIVASSGNLGSLSANHYRKGESNDVTT